MYVPNISNLIPSDDFLVDLGQGIWLMDNHRWALFVWEEQRKSNKYILVHADQHWDGCYDFNEDPVAEKELLITDAAGIKEFIIKNEQIRFDSFIAPAVIRGLFDVVHFYCTEDNDNEVGMYEEWLANIGGKQVIHADLKSLAEIDLDFPLIFDLCLDLFNRSNQMDEGDLWDFAEIRYFLESLRKIIAAAELVTISLSFGYSGTHEDTRNLAKFVIPIIMSLRHLALPNP